MQLMKLRYHNDFRQIDFNFYKSNPYFKKFHASKFLFAFRISLKDNFNTFHKLYMHFFIRQTIKTWTKSEFSITIHVQILDNCEFVDYQLKNNTLAIQIFLQYVSMFSFGASVKFEQKLKLIEYCKSSKNCGRYFSEKMYFYYILIGYFHYLQR